MKKIVIVHILPIENYPPVINLMNYLSKDMTIECFTTQTDSFSNFTNDDVRVRRIKSSGTSSIARLLGYCRIYLKIFYFLVKLKPKEVIYYDTISASPVCLYKLLYKHTRVFVHYHEYVMPREYKNGMIINRLAHKYLETRNYSKATWISQTNEFRRDLFCKDNNLELNTVKVFPNYPPLHWGNGSVHKETEVLKIVFVGYSVNAEGSYSVEILEWLERQNTKIIVHFYLVNKTLSPKALYADYENLAISIYDAVNYQQLPSILNNYDVGLILYKPTADNWIFNAPNKLFEYLACGLDVWFPNDMIGTLPYENIGVYPKVKSLDFKNLEGISFIELISREGLKRKTTEYFCEHIYEKLKQEILK